MGFGDKLFEKQIKKDSGVLQEGTESGERKGLDIKNKSNEYADIVNAELEDDEFLKEKEEKYTKQYVPIDQVADTSLMDDEEEELPENAELMALRAQQRDDMIQYNKDHAGENGISGVKRPDLSKAKFTEKATVNYKSWTNRDGQTRSRVQSVDTEDISQKDKKAA